MEYWLYAISSGEREDSAEAHVLARAYRAAWRVTRLSEPTGMHRFLTLDLAICYGGSAPPKTAISDDDDE
jgi:hypothetical protein